MKKDFERYLIVGIDIFNKRNEILAIFENLEDAKKCYSYICENGIEKKYGFVRKLISFHVITIELNNTVFSERLCCLENPTQEELYEYAISKSFI